MEPLKSACWWRLFKTYAVLSGSAGLLCRRRSLSEAAGRQGRQNGLTNIPPTSARHPELVGLAENGQPSRTLLLHGTEFFNTIVRL